MACALPLVLSMTSARLAKADQLSIITVIKPMATGGPNRHSSRTLHAGHRGQVAMRLAADVILELNIIAKRVHETRLPIPRVILRIVHGDDDFELVRTDLADTLC